MLSAGTNVVRYRDRGGGGHLCLHRLRRFLRQVVRHCTVGPWRRYIWKGAQCLLIEAHFSAPFRLSPFAISLFDVPPASLPQLSAGAATAYRTQATGASALPNSASERAHRLEGAPLR